MTSKTSLPHDPQGTADAEKVANALKSGKLVITRWAHLTPIKIKTNSKTLYRATYKDDYGTYKFSVSKNKGVYTVVSDGHTLYIGSDKDHINWEYEVQLAAVNPLVLK